MPTIKVRAGKKDEPVWVLSLDREWRKGLLTHVSATHLSIDIDENFIERGMSGSPVLNANAYAVGVVALGTHASSPALPGVLPVSQWNKMKPSRKNAALGQFHEHDGHLDIVRFTVENRPSCFPFGARVMACCNSRPRLQLNGHTPRKARVYCHEDQQFSCRMDLFQHRASSFNYLPCGTF